MKEIIIEFDEKTGECVLKTKGFKGKECLDASKFLKEALGKTIKEIKTSEYYQSEETVKQRLKY